MGNKGSDLKCGAIVIGSGIGGLACACALTRMGHSVLVLERHFVTGRLTQTFSRDGFTWDVDVHYLREMGPQDAGRRVLDWLSGGALEFASIGPVYHTLRPLLKPPPSAAPYFRRAPSLNHLPLR